MYYKYIGTTFARLSPTYTMGGIKPDVCPYQNYDLPAWSALVSNNSMRRGVLPGKPSVITEALPGGCFDYTDGPKPKDIVTPIADIKQHTKRKKKEFEALKAANKIVLSPMLAETSAIRSFQGVSSPSSVVVNDSLTIRSLNTPATLVERNPCNGYFEPGYGIYESLGGLEMDFPLRAGPSVNIAIHRQYEKIAAPIFTTPPISVAYGFYGQIQDALRQPYDEGLITSLVAEANSATWDLLTELGEARETISYIFGLLGSIVDLVVKVKKDIFRARRRPGASAASIADEIASIWMQFRYAITPLGFSVNDSLDYLQSQYSPFQTFRKGNRTTLELTPIDGWSCQDLEIVDRVFLKYQYGYESVTHGLKMNPFATAWELTTLSFVVDWVLNVGDLLSSLVTPSSVIQTGCQYSRQIRQQSLTIKHEDSTLGHHILDIRYYKADPINPLAHIGLTIDPSMTWKRWLDAIALTWGFTKGKLR